MSFPKGHWKATSVGVEAMGDETMECGISVVVVYRCHIAGLQVICLRNGRLKTPFTLKLYSNIAPGRNRPNPNHPCFQVRHVSFGEGLCYFMFKSKRFTHLVNNHTAICWGISTVFKEGNTSTRISDPFPSYVMLVYQSVPLLNAKENRKREPLK